LVAINIQFVWLLLAGL